MTLFLPLTCASVSLLALGIAVAVYTHALRQSYRDSYRNIWPGLILQTLWLMAMAAARVLALVLFASIFNSWVFLVLGEWLGFHFLVV